MRPPKRPGLPRQVAKIGGRARNLERRVAAAATSGAWANVYFSATPQTVTGSGGSANVTWEHFETSDASLFFTDDDGFAPLNTAGNDRLVFTGAAGFLAVFAKVAWESGATATEIRVQHGGTSTNPGLGTSEYSPPVGDGYVWQQMIDYVPLPSSAYAYGFDILASNNSGGDLDMVKANLMVVFVSSAESATVY